MPKWQKAPAPEPGSKPTKVINKTIHNTTINNYFSKAEGPAPSPIARPANLFPNDERRNYKYIPWNGKTRPVLVSAATPEGALLAGCVGCTKNSCAPMDRFAPPECRNNARKRPQFYLAMEAYEAAYKAKNLDAARAARADVELYRVAYCPPCQEVANKLSPAQQACKDEWERMRKEACAKFGGCQNPDCVERGEEAWCVLQGDHVHTAKEEDEDKRKTHILSDYVWWAWNGGVEAMRAEAAKGLNWWCAFCHALEPTGNQANKYGDPDKIPDGKSRGTKEEAKQYDRKRKAKIVYPKQQFVDARKRKIGCCELCERDDVAGKEHAFTFDHRDPSTKMRNDPKTGKKTLAGEKGGVAGLVSNCANAAKLETIEYIIVNEMAKCRLLCRNCDHRHTFGYLV